VCACAWDVFGLRERLLGVSDPLTLYILCAPCRLATGQDKKLYGPRCNCSFQAASSSWGPYLQAELNTSYMLVELLCTLEALPPLCGWVRSEGSGSGDEMVRWQ
jgi:hypothetical protein